MPKMQKIDVEKLSEKQERNILASILDPYVLPITFTPPLKHTTQILQPPYLYFHSIYSIL